MSTIPVGQAAQAYVRALQQNVNGGESPEPSVKSAAGGQFAQMVESAIGDMVKSGGAGEAAAAKAISGKAEIADIVTAVANAEVALETVVAIRDKVIGAYQEIMRMPV